MDIEETIVEIETMVPMPAPRSNNWFLRTWQNFVDGWSFDRLAIGRPQFFSLTMPLYVIALTVLLSGILIASTFVYVQRAAIAAANNAALTAGQDPTAQAGATPANQAVNVSAVSTIGDPYIGNPNAPVTMAYWSDYQCPFCKQFETTIFSQIISNYVDTGKLRVVFKDFQFLGPDSLTDAEIARAIWQLYPSEFYPWRAAMYENQGEENHNADPAGEMNTLNLTKTIPGIDVTKVAAYVTANKAQLDAAIQADQTQGEQFGIQGTPSFIVGNGNPVIVGGATYAQFSSLIDAALK